MERRGLNGLGQFRAGRFHERGVERAAHRELDGALCTGGLELLAGGVDGLFLSGDDHLAGGVVVGGNHAGDAGADLLNDIVPEFDDGGHGAGHFLAALLHFAGADGYQAQAVFPVHGSGGHQGAEFAQGVTGYHVRLLFLLHGEQDAVQENGRLGNLGCPEVFFRTLEHDVCNAEPKDLVGPFHQVFMLGI